MHTPVPIALPPGIQKELSPATLGGRWVDCNLVRFWKGMPERWGGWQRYTTYSLQEPARGALDWRALDGRRLIAWGTANYLWLLYDDVLYDITPTGLSPGLVDGVGSVGWSSTQEPGLGWGQHAWGGQYSLIAGNGGRPRTWMLAKWGEDLVACARGGPLYHWKRSNGPHVRAQIIPNAPITNAGVFSTEGDRHLVALGAHDGTTDDSLRLAWANQETLDQWTPLITNTAGDFRTEYGNEQVGAIPVTGGTLILTDTSAYMFRYIGGEFVFATERVAGFNGMIAPHAGTEVAGAAVWMGENAFYSYDGAVRPIPCDVHQFVFGRLNRKQAHKIYCSRNQKFGEVIWFYPDIDSNEVNRYVTLSDGVWSVGALSRTSWIDTNVALDNPIATGPDGKIYIHEAGVTADGQPMPYYLESGEIGEMSPQMMAGSGHVMLRKVIPDWQRLDGTHRLDVITRAYPKNTETVKGPYEYDAATGQFSVRARGASYRLRFHGDGDFRLGRFHTLVTSDGARS